MLSFGGDIGCQLGEVHPERAIGLGPQCEGLSGGRDQRLGVVLTPEPARVAGQEPGQACLSQPDDCVRVGIAGQHHQRGLAVVRPEHCVPGRAEQLDQRVEPGVDRGAPLDHRGALLGQPAQRVGRSGSGELTQPLGVQQRQLGEDLGIEAVVLGVLGVVGPQVRRLGGRDHHHPRAPGAEPVREHDPGIAGRFEDHGQLGRVLQVKIAPQPLQIGRPRHELAALPQRLAVYRQRRLMLGPTGHIDTQTDRGRRDRQSQSCHSKDGGSD